MIDPRTVRVRDAMTEDVQTLNGAATLEEAIATLDDYGLGGAPVVDDAGEVIGVFSRTDLARRDAEVGANETPRASSYFNYGVGERFLVSKDEYDPATYDRETVGDWMTSDVKSVPPEASVADAAWLMASEGVHRLLVLEDGRLAGIITAMDVVALVGKAAAEPRARKAKTRRRRAS